MHYNHYNQTGSYNHYNQTGSYYNHPPKRSVATDPVERIDRMASASAVVVFTMSTCCMCHAVKRLFCGMGVNPTVYEIDQDFRGDDLEAALKRMLGGADTAVPAVFIGGKLVGAMDSVVAAHISGALVPLLKDAGALWL